MDHSEPHILVVDDDERIRTLLARFLTGQSFRITTAEDAADAAAKMTAVAFDLLVVDVMLPGQAGFAFVPALRQRPTQNGRQSSRESGCQYVQFRGVAGHLK